MRLGRQLSDQRGHRKKTVRNKVDKQLYKKPESHRLPRMWVLRDRPPQPMVSSNS